MLTDEEAVNLLLGYEEIHRQYQEIFSEIQEERVMSNHIYTNQNGRCAHIKLKVKGNLKKINFFNFLIGAFDPDWPYAPNRRDADENIHCPDCEGDIYRVNRFDADELKTIAKQVDANKRLPGNFSLKVKMFNTNPTCKYRMRVPKELPKQIEGPKPEEGK